MTKTFCDKCEIEMWTKENPGGWEDWDGKALCGKCAEREKHYEKKEPTKKVEPRSKTITPLLDKIPGGARQ